MQLFNSSKTNEKNSDLKKITDLIAACSSSQNHVISTYLNNIKNEFIVLPEEIKIPRIPVSSITAPDALQILPDLARLIPEFLSNHEYLPHKRPESDTHYLHFIQHIKGQLLDFVHIFKLDMRYGGGSDSMIDKGDANHYPAFSTKHLYYKSRLIPVKSSYDPANPGGFESLIPTQAPYFEIEKEEFQQNVFSFFDDLKVGEITNKLMEIFDPGLFNISLGLYPFITYDYLTATFSILNPTPQEINNGIIIFEPLYFLIFAKYNKIEQEYLAKILASTSMLKLDNNNILKLSDEGFEQIKKYFLKYSIHRDENLLLKGWWKFEY